MRIFTSQLIQSESLEPMPEESLESVYRNAHNCLQSNKNHLEENTRLDDDDGGGFHYVGKLPSSLYKRRVYVHVSERLKAKEYGYCCCRVCERRRSYG
jgi:predicted methyltransferase